MLGKGNWRVLIALLAVVAMLGAACGGGGDEEEDAGGSEVEHEEFEAGSTMAKIQEKGEITIGVKFDVPPFGFENPQSGEVEGFDVDMGKYIAEHLGVEPKFVEAISDNRIPFLQDGTVDIILSTMTITTDREAEIDFSNPYFIANGRILVPEDSDIAGIDDLAGRKVCTAIGSTYESTLTEQAPDADLKTVEAYSDCLTLLQNGQVEAVSTDNVILTGMIIQSGEDFPLKLVGDNLTTEPYGVGIPNETDDMRDFINGVLTDSFEDGTWQETYDKWVGQYVEGDPEHPEDFTLDDALKLFPCVEFCDK
ncbi:MAG: glutamate ABC transporter substrate-binding protein [Actinomycetota bacterium]